MLENLKTYVLIFLVLSSLFLCGKLWFGANQYEVADEPTSERIDFGDTAGVFEQVTPDKIFLKLDEKSFNNAIEDEDITGMVYGWGRHTSQYEKLWSLIKEDLIQQGTSIEMYNNKEDIPRDLIDDHNKLVLDFSFPVSSLLQNSLNASPFLDNRIKEASRLVLSLDSNNIIKSVFLMDSNENSSILELKFDYDSELLVEELENGSLFTDEYKYKNLKEEEILRQVDLEETASRLTVDEANDLEGTLAKDVFSYTLTTNGDIFIPEEEGVLVRKEIEYEELEKNKLATAFFHDLSFVRKIDEWDGGFIFTDGQKGLRFLPDGGFEYDAPYRTSPAPSGFEEKKLSEIIGKSGEYISLYGGWDENLSLDEVKIVDPSMALDDSNYTTVYKYFHKDYPVVNIRPLTIDFDFQGVFNFARKVPGNIETAKIVDSDEEMMEVEEIIVEWLKEELLKQGQKNLEEIDEVLSKVENNEKLEVKVVLRDVKYGFFIEDTEGSVGKEDNKDTMIPVLIIKGETDKFIYNALNGEMIKNSKTFSELL